MSGNKFGNKGGLHIPGMLQVNTTLEYIDVADADLVRVWLLQCVSLVLCDVSVRYRVLRA